MTPAIAILLCVLALIAARRIGRLRIRIWQAMTGGALVALAMGTIPPRDALRAIDPDVMAFLFGMFVVGEALVASGYLQALAHRLFTRVRSTDGLVLTVLFAAGAASAVLMNDTLAIVGTPLAVQLARAHRIAPSLLLLALAFAITIGSVASPIGNPQNLLIAVQGRVTAPFTDFALALGPPTLLNLLIAYGVLRLRYAREFHAVPLVHAAVELRDPGLARLSRIALGLILFAIALKAASVTVGLPFGIRLSHIALAGALPLLIFSPRRAELLRRVDWVTLLFFVAMFVLMAAVWRSGFLQQQLARLPTDPSAIPTVAGVGLLLSQLISNVPLVALYLPVLQHAGAGDAALLTLAASSTIAGNLLILGAASNVIVIQRAERAGIDLGLREFATAGIPLALLNMLVYLVYLEWYFQA